MCSNIQEKLSYCVSSKSTPPKNTQKKSATKAWRELGRPFFIGPRKHRDAYLQLGLNPKHLRVLILKRTQRCIGVFNLPCKSRLLRRGLFAYHMRNGQVNIVNHQKVNLRGNLKAY